MDGSDPVNQARRVAGDLGPLATPDRPLAPAATAPQREQYLEGSQVENQRFVEGHDPRLMFHGTASAPFNAFSPERSDLGIHVGSLVHAQDRLHSKGNVTDGVLERAQVIPLYAKAKNLLRLQDYGNFQPANVISQLEDQEILSDKDSTQLLKKIRDQSPASPYEIPNSGGERVLREHLKGLGYDGVVYLNRGEGVGKGEPDESGHVPRDMMSGDYTDQDVLNYYPDAHDSYILFDAGQVKSPHASDYDESEKDYLKASGGEVEGDDEWTEVYPLEPEHAEKFMREEKAFGGAVDVNPNYDQNLARFMEGNHHLVPHVLYTGTTGDFSEFDTRKANIESDLGAGIYASNAKEDVSANYAGEGPDLTNRLEHVMDTYRNSDEEFSEEELRNMARAQLSVKHGGMMMPIHVSMKNPVVLGGKHETYFDFHEPYNEEKDEYGEPSGSLVPMLNALEKASRKFDADPRYVKQELIEKAAQEGGIKASDAERIIKGNYAIESAYDDEGKSAANEVFRKTLENMGHDGIIDTTVDRKFGTSRRGVFGAKVPGMAGVGPGTIHYVAFKSGQIKSALGNDGTFDHPTDITKAEGGSVDTLLDSTGKPVHHTPEGVEAFKQWFGDSKSVDDQGRPVVVYRGVRGDASKGFSAGALNAEPRGEDWAAFATTSPSMAATYAAPDFTWDEAGALVPVYVKADKLIEFPVRKTEYGNTHNKLEFDKRAMRLSPGHVLVARNVVDTGPAAPEAYSVDKEKRYSYPADIYAWRPGTSVKSAVGNDGTFDHPTDITKADGGSVDTLLDSTGKPVHHTPEGVENFKRWHEGSKVVDEQGRPRVMYHGTILHPGTNKDDQIGDIQSFDRLYTTKFRRPSVDTIGSWFSTNPGEGGAEMYSGASTGSAIYPVYLSIKNPYKTTHKGVVRRAHMLAGTWEGYDHNGRRPVKGQPGVTETALYNMREKQVNALRQWLSDSGRDGIQIVHDPADEPRNTEFKHQDAWIALEPEQIKSAVGNTGEFSPEEKRITKAEGGEVDSQPPVQPAPPARKFNSIGLYSHAAEQALKLPQTRGSLDQLLGTLKNKGVKQDEIDHSGVEQQFAGRPSVTKQELADHFNANMPEFSPKTDTSSFKKWSLQEDEENRQTGGKLAGKNYREHLLRLSNPSSDQPFTESHWPSVENIAAHLRTQDFKAEARAPRIAWEHPELNTTTRVTDLGIPSRPETREFPSMQTSIPGLVVNKSKYGKSHEYNLTHADSGLALLNTVPYHVIRQFVDEIKPLGINWELPKEQLLPTIPKELKDKAVSMPSKWEEHYGNPVPARVKKKAKPPDRDNVLLIDELQSDWGQKARDRGIKGTDSGPDNWSKEREGLIKKLKHANFEQQQSENEYQFALNRLGEEMGLHAARVLANDVHNDPDKPDVNENFTAASEKRSNARQTRNILLNVLDRHEDNRGKGPVPQGPYINSTEKWSDLALKYALKKAVDEGKTHLVLTPAKVQTDRYGSAVQQMVDSFLVTHHPDTGTFKVSALKNGEHQYVSDLSRAFLLPSEVKKILGKELTDLVTQNNPDNEIDSPHSYMERNYRYNLEGDVGIGKSGQEFMYDKLIPKRLLALARQHDPEANLTTYQGEHEPIKGFPAIRITPAMAESIRTKGFKAFKRGGAVSGVDRALRVARKARGMT